MDFVCSGLSQNPSREMNDSISSRRFFLEDRSKIPFQLFYFVIQSFYRLFEFFYHFLFSCIFIGEINQMLCLCDPFLPLYEPISIKITDIKLHVTANRSPARV
jgi:hypothetical protein